MTPEEYIEAVENYAREDSKDCFHRWREELQDINISTEESRAPDRCECFYNNDKTCTKCIQCTRCTLRYNPNQVNSIHSSAGDYETLPEVYLASNLVKPWYDHKVIKYFPYGHDLIKDNRKVMKMTETEILDGLLAIERKYPNIVAWITYKTLYTAIIARMPSVIAFVTNWMERREQYFTPSGLYHRFSSEYNVDYTNEYEIRLDLPLIALDGINNLPRYLSGKDSSARSINTNHAISDWVEKNEVSEELINLLGRALASNAHQWQSMTCCAMNGYNVLKDFLGHISHAIDANGKQRDIYYSLWGGSTPTINNPKKIIWHTHRTRCYMCTLDTHKGHTKYCSQCIPAVITEPLAVKPYECIIAHAIAVRRRKFSGVLRCATILLGRARMMHFRPGVGSYFKEAENRWNTAILESEIKNISPQRIPCK